jgi:hypothetical protein
MKPNPLFKLLIPGAVEPLIPSTRPSSAEAFSLTPFDNPSPRHAGHLAEQEAVHGRVLADRAAIHWSGLYARRFLCHRVVDGFLVLATAEPLVSCGIAIWADFREREVGGPCNPLLPALPPFWRPFALTPQDPMLAGLLLKRIGLKPSVKAPIEYFTDSVRIDPLFEPPDPSRALGASITLDLDSGFPSLLLFLSSEGAFRSSTKIAVAQNTANGKRATFFALGETNDKGSAYERIA